MESALADQFNRAARNGSPAGIAVRTGKPDYAIGRCNANLAACASGDTAISDGAGPVSNRSAKSKRQRLAAKGNAAFGRTVKLDDAGAHIRSEEHTSELQSLMRISYAVLCLKKTNTYTTICDTCLHKLKS